jgi:hypothetical protein
VTQADPYGRVRDYAFVMYQQNLPLMLGSAGAAAGAWLWWRGRRGFARSRRRFWAGMVLVCVPLAVATAGTPEPRGLGHVVLQPLALVGLAFLAAAGARAPRGLVAVLLAGACLDFALGVFLHVSLESRVIENAQLLPGGRYAIDPADLDAFGLNNQAMRNWAAKAAYRLPFASPGGMTFWGDHFAECREVLQALIAAGFAGAVLLVGRALLSGAAGRGCAGRGNAARKRAGY